MSGEQHQQTEISVRAYVDLKIAPIIVALNRIPGVVTIESCQESWPGLGWACFFHQGGETLRRRLIGQMKAATAGIPGVVVQSYPSSRGKLGELIVPTERFQEVVRALESLA